MDHAAPPVFTVNGSIIGESDKVKYLGHIICNDMSDEEEEEEDEFIWLHI